MTIPRVAAGAGGVLVVCAGLAVASVLAALQGGLAWALAGVLALAGLAAIGAVTRIVLTDDPAQARAMGLRPLGFQFGRAELRLFWAGLLCLLFLAMVLVLVVLVLLAMFGIAELNAEAITRRDWTAVGPVWKLAVLALVGLGGVAIPIMLAARLAMFVPATVARGQAISLLAMVISRGNVGVLVISLCLASVPTLLIALSGVKALIVFVMTLVQMPLSMIFLGLGYRRLEGRPTGE